MGVILAALLGVAVIALCAVVLSYSGIYQIAVQGGVDEPLTHLYPGLFTLLLLMAFWTTYLLREAPRQRRLWVDALVLALILLAAAASAMHSLRYEFLDWVAAVIVAVAPWAALLIAFRLLLWILGQLREERPRPLPDRTSAPTGDIPAEHETDDVDWSGAERTTATLSRPAAAAPAPPPNTASEPIPAPAPGSASGELPRLSDLSTTEPIPAPVPEPVVEPEPRPETLSGHDNWSVERTLALPKPLPEPAERATAVETPPQASPELVDHAGPDEVREELPKRPPKSGESAIRKAASAPKPLGDVSEPDHVLAADSGSDGSAALDDDFDPVELPDDPTSDEAYELIEEHTGSAARFTPDPEPDPEPAPQVRKRPILLKPRKISELPPDPPSGRVRSAPTPPQD